MAFVPLPPSLAPPHPNAGPGASCARTVFPSREQAESPEVRDVLEAMDDAMFAAIAGDDGALATAQSLWRQFARTLPRPLVEESREQYLRYAAEVLRQGDASDVRTPAASAAALEVVELVTDG